MGNCPSSAPDKWGHTEVNVDKFTYNWTISNYRDLSSAPGEYLDSPCFSMGPEKEPNWFLRLHPLTSWERYSSNLSFALFLGRKPAGKAPNGLYSLSVLNRRGTKLAEKRERFSSEESQLLYGYSRFSQRDYQVRARDLLFSGRLTIRCEVLVDKGCVESTSEDDERLEPRREPVPYPYHRLFLDERLSDVRLLAPCGRSLPAHKPVLVTRSPVFKAMFAHDMQESRTNEVKIADSSYEALEQMLRFIYLDHLENIEPCAGELLRLADKYQIPDLAGFCEEALSRSMSPDNVIDIIALAQDYAIDHLKRQAIEFARAHLREVLRSEKLTESLRDVQLVKSVLEAVLE